MKISRCLNLRRTLFFVLFGMSLGLSPMARPAGLSLNPASISNTYSGPITLTITGLTNGESVLVERFLDANSNGAVDSGESLVQSFQVTEGQVTSFGGIRNSNVPGDEDGATNGQVQTVIRFSAFPEFSRGAGNHLLRLSSPGGRFAPVLQTLIVTQAATAQRVTGRIASGGSAVPYALVALLVQSGDDVQFLAGAVADASGNFSINAAPGTYLVLPAKVGFVSDISSAPVVTLGAGQVISTNLNLIQPTRTISGKVSDVANGNGIPGLQLFIESTAANTISFAFTDAGGNFTASVLPDQWKINLSELSLSQGGYLRPQSKPRFDTTASNVSGAQVPLAKETALIYGNLKDSSNNLLTGVSLFAGDSNNQYEGSAVTDPNGNYTLGVIAGNWSIGADNQDPALAGYLVQGTNLTVADGRAVQVNFVAIRSTAHLRGWVIDSGGAPVSGLQILAIPQNGGSGASATTAADGSFDVGVFGGSWTLQLESSGAAQRNLIGPSLSYPNVTDGANISNILYVVRSVTAQITGVVLTTNAVPIPNLNLYASITVNGTNYNVNARTDGSGNYSLAVFNGAWQVGLNCYDVNPLGYECPSSQTVNVSGPNAVANFTLQPIAPLQITTPGLPDGSVGASYDVALSASGGAPPYTWSLAPASGALPPGIALFANGFVSGVPSAAGTYNFNVRVTDQNSATDDQALTLSVNTASPLQITTTSLPNASVGVSYSVQLQATGGQAPYTWSLAPGSALPPPGFTLSSAGILSGVASVAGTFDFTFRVADATASFDEQPLSLAITSSTGVWTYRPFLASGRVAPAAAEIGGFLYAVGGFTDTTGALGMLEVYNPLLGSWHTLASMPTPRGRLAVGVINGRLYAAGGFGGEAALEVYDPVANSWSIRRPMSVSRLGCAAGAVGNLLYVAGGTSDSARTLEVYDPATDTWTLKAPMPTPRYLLAGGVISNRLYAVGGVNAVTGGPGLNTLEVYDPATDSWSSGAAMPTPRSDLAASVLDGKLYVLGGFSAPQLEIYDPALNSWTSVTPMATARGDLAAAAVGPRLFAIGGTTAPGQTPLPLVEQYAPVLDDKLATVILSSDATISAAGLGTGAPSSAMLSRLDAGETSGLTFSSAAVGAFGSGVSIPVGAPQGTAIINISSGDGQNGFFKRTFVLPEGFAGIQLSLAANVDFYGRAFLNGLPITPALGQNGRITQNGNAMFAVRDAALFRSGTNELLIACANSDGGASGAAFYAFVTYRPVPLLNQLSRPANNEFQFRIGGTTNETYSLQFSTNLLYWTTLISTNPPGGSFNFVDSNATGSHRFYRVLLGQ